MIFGNITNLCDEQGESACFDESIRQCFSYAQKNDLATWDTGSYPIDGERLFVNIVEYTTTTPENRFWEAHRAYLDLHLLLSGTEQIDLNFIQNMEQQDYVPKDDFLPMRGDKNSSVRLQAGDYLICYPNDGHRTAVVVNEPCTVKKAIFKIRIERSNTPLLS